MAFYQRLLAGDQEEAESLLEEHVKTRSLEEVYDTVVIPALVLAERDRKAGTLTDDQIEFIWNATNDLLEDLRGRIERCRNGPGGNPLGVPLRRRVFG